ncbi:MAG: hypothetical protein IPK44_15790 [Candidatus Accumulibacter sp.]|uniref:hypothetical protein n=1 Tax=Accumulibacter sp. TaxID=2053492 RepID=UPI0025851066|nr:hypothetical protein [Accumulibacter sp.]MBK8115842.1 hypothetical protein [Accumulibacter sp.]
MMSNVESNNLLCKVGQRLSFRDDAGISPYLLGGWADHELNHRWTVGRRAQVQLHVSNAGRKDLLLRVQCSPFLAGGKLSHQTVDVLVNGVHVATWLVREMSWQEASVPNHLISAGDATLTFVIGHPSAPVDSQLSTDPRMLGVDFRVLEIAYSPQPDLNDPTLEWIGKGEDPVGDVFKADGNYFRAIKHSAAGEVRNLIARDVYRQLARRNLIPEHHFSDVGHPKYAMVAHTHAGTFVYPPTYALLTFRDAAIVWLDINEFLMNVDVDYGLIDGHYGNFALFNNSRPMWVDIGSIGRKGGSLQGCPDFGLAQFVQCYVYPLLMFQNHPDTEYTRHLMLTQPGGITYEQLKDALPGYLGIDDLGSLASGGDRSASFRRIRDLLGSVDFSAVKGFWSGYRNVGSLEWAIQGKWLDGEQDSRFRAVVGLVRRSAASAFLDIGANDGLFSLLCTREGRKGIATDLDDFSLNKLYQFISTRPAVELSIAHGSFLKITHSAELVLALAITHHLVISQGLTFDQISKTLARNSSRALITEFMPDGLGGTAENPEPVPNPLPVDYTLENFVGALKNEFGLVEVIDYLRPNPSSRRILIYCENPKIT